MEQLILDILKDPTQILAGLPLDFERIAPDSRRTIMICALHCVLNGPVGVAKSTHFPMLEGEMKIKDLIKVSNSGWKGFCGGVATVVKRLYPDLKCSSRERNHDLWPIAEWK
jgi:hypothetical protein